MRKNDKLIIVVGVIILVLAAIGIYYWEYEEVVRAAEIDDFYTITGEMEDLPLGITVSDSNPFYALIATPIQFIMIQNMNNMLYLFILKILKILLVLL